MPTVREVVAVAAPSEVPLLDGLASLDDESLGRLLGRRRGLKEPLGSGPAEVAGLAAPVVWPVVDEVARQAVRATVDTAARRIRRAVRGLLRRPPRSARTVPSLTSGQLETVHRKVRERAGEAGIERAAAAALADAVVSRLARESASDAPEAPELHRSGEATA
ncbi:hypothetical protein ACFY12_12140 [Streptomyces sp. NPDC001339]|uniref:hypothetical protein n=1 Tax=Streptomyces sp. NPDC001339 TaxID=3364563 RepID=UPI00369421C0